MNRNQKIALGCGGAGCLGLIVVAVAAGLVFFFYRASPNRNYNYNVSTNRNRNYNSNDNSNVTANDNSSNSSNSSKSASTSASTISDDDKHKLYQAAGMTGDAELIRRVSVRIGLMDEDYTPGDNYQEFIEQHVSWAIRNTDFIQSINTAEKARAYVNSNFPD
jgi:hypothetical protein